MAGGTGLQVASKAAAPLGGVETLVEAYKAHRVAAVGFVSKYSYSYYYY